MKPTRMLHISGTIKVQFQKYSADLSIDDIRSEFHEALAKWAAVSHVNFVEVSRTNGVFKYL